MIRGLFNKFLAVNDDDGLIGRAISRWDSTDQLRKNNLPSSVAMSIAGSSSCQRFEAFIPSYPTR